MADFKAIAQHELKPLNDEPRYDAEQRPQHAAHASVDRHGRIWISVGPTIVYNPAALRYTDGI